MVTEDVRPLDVLLWVSALTILVVMLFALRGIIRLRSAIKGLRGYALTSVVLVVTAGVTFAQFCSLANATLILVNRTETIDYRVVIFIVENAVKAVVVVYAFWKIRRLALLADLPDAERRDTIERPKPDTEEKTK